MAGALALFMLMMTVIDHIPNGAFLLGASHIIHDSAHLPGPPMVLGLVSDITSSKTRHPRFGLRVPLLVICTYACRVKNGSMKILAQSLCRSNSMVLSSSGGIAIIGQYIMILYIFVRHRREKNHEACASYFSTYSGRPRVELCMSSRHQKTRLLYDRGN